MYHPSMWHPIQSLDMAAAFRSIRQTTSSPNSTTTATTTTTTSPDKNSLSAAVAAFNAANGAFSVNTLLNQTSSDHLRFSSTHPSLTAAAAVHQHHLFSTLFHHYPYAAAFRPLLNNTTSTTGLLTSSTNSNSSLSSSSTESSESSAFLPTGKRFKNNTHDENHCDISPSEKSSDESFGKYSENRCRSSTYDLQNPQCPICQISLNGQDMITHIQHELDTIERTRQQYKYSIRRSSHLTNGNNSKILQENTINNIDQTFKTRYETYIRVRTSRQQRLNAKLQLHNRRINRNDTRNCPICYQIIPINTDEEYFCTHVQQCSRKREQLAANAALVAIANQHRVPPPPPPAPPLVLQTRESTQDDPDVNVVDMDDGIEHEDNNSNRQSTNETTSTVDHSDDRCQESFNSDQRFSPSTQKSDILYSSNVNELDPPKCVVCMESCIKPCVSLICWHINCEECWLKYLNEKNICPQCHLQTTSKNLRRIFFK
ncbi:unnamed protein product [Rotaria sp. Silwood1]|nr:unnamed protein product [Rotaria sp. Silwood1]CAF3826626.1 unnamed protein product [Rotaria sp. Silwood1]CAF4729415.1 unnamed protein product [Rotaria sp. Silwood1]